MSKIISFFKLKSKITAKDFKLLLILFIISLIASFLFSNLSIKYLDNEMKFNILDAIGIQYWLWWLVKSFLLMALIRMLLIGVFTKYSFEKEYYLETFIHSIKFSLLIIPVFMVMIVIVGNHIFVDEFLKNTQEFNKMNNLAILSILMWVLIWLIFLGLTTRIFLQRHYSKLSSWILNPIISILTTSILGLSILQYSFVDTKEHAEKLQKVLIESVEKNFELTKECREKIMTIKI